MSAEKPNNDEWYLSIIESMQSEAVSLDREKLTVTYSPKITSGESHVRSAQGEELSHAVIVAMLTSDEFSYSLSRIGHERYFAHGSKGSNSDEVDILIEDEDGLTFALFEVKRVERYESEKAYSIEHQLFGTAPLTGSPKLLVYATVEPKGNSPVLKCVCIDHARYKTYDAWVAAGSPSSQQFPKDYQDLSFKPYTNQGDHDLVLNATTADFRAVALTFHNEFFGEHPDNTIFVNLVKCLLAKIFDERTRKVGEPYHFQVLYKNGKPSSAEEVFEEVNQLYKDAYKRYIDPHPDKIDEINPKEFGPERVKAVVLGLQSLSITKGAAKHGDVIGAFFEEVLRAGFKQDRGMYFTHDNIVNFMVEALDLSALTKSVWKASDHPENRIPYIIDPACGSGTFLLHAMNCVTSTVKDNESQLVNDHDSEQFYNARLSASQPNYWAENFIYGIDPKFIMAITAKVNMVLHGDGSAHIAKDDAFLPLGKYKGQRFKPLGDEHRSVPCVRYHPDVCESFDVIISNPPFGITLSAETKTSLSKTYTLPPSTPSEGLFVERCFQLLKPNGRMAVVLPESLLNAREMHHCRLLLYRFFNLKAIVSMPRNIFIDTPTLTSLVFAEKKSALEIETWDEAWQQAVLNIEKRIQQARVWITKDKVAEFSPSDLIKKVLAALAPVFTGDEWIIRSGKGNTILSLSPTGVTNSSEVAIYYNQLFRAAGFKGLIETKAFGEVVRKHNVSFPVFRVSEVGYKLSKRKEKARPNQLCEFRAKDNNDKMYRNLHLAGQECRAIYESKEPQTVLEIMRKEVKWGSLK